jgi:putative oxidoreductase
LITPVGRSSLSGSIASLALRGFLGTVMIMHGAPKLTKHKEKTVQSMEKLGVPKEATISASLLEVAGGAALLAGFMVPVVSSLFAAEMTGTTLLNKKKMGKQFLSGGEKPPYELDVMYAVAFGILAVIGGGEFSVDRLLKL